MKLDPLTVVVRELFAASNALAVMLVDYDGTAVATSGDPRTIPEPLRHGLSGKALEDAGSLGRLLEPFVPQLQACDNVLQVNVVEPTHLLIVAYDDVADPDLPAHVRRARATLTATLRSSLC